MTTSNIFNILLIGPSGVGKSAYILRQLTGQYFTNHISNQKLVIYNPLTYQTNYGKYTFNLYEVNNIANIHLIPHIIDAVFLMIDDDHLTNEYHNLCKLYPSILLVNKTDLKLYKRHTYNQILQFYQDCNFVSKICISVKGTYNVQLPFLHILKQLTKYNDICFSDYRLNYAKL